jgi:hypothetical protein
MKITRSRIAPILLLALIAAPAPASAQAARTGPTFRVGGTTNPVILPDVAHDPTRNRYLVVSGNVFIEGQLLDANGAKIAGFPIAGGEYAQTPRVAYSPDVNGGAGGYLVTWHQTVGPIAQVRGKLLSADGAAISGDIVIATETAAAQAGTGSNWTMGAAVAYSTGSREFLVAWMGGYFTTQDIRFNRVNTAGAVLQGTVAITGGVDWERDPSVAYNPAQDEFYIAYAGYVDAGRYGYVNGQRVKAGTGALIGGATTFIQSAATMIPAVEYNRGTGQYVVAWYNRTSASAAFYGVSVNGATGALVGGVRVMSARYFAYDALDIAYNSGSGDFLLVTHGAGIQDYEDAAVPINADGTPYDNGFILTNTPDVRAVVSGDGNFNPRVAAAAQGRYLTVTSSRFAAVHGQFATSSANGGGGQPQPQPGSNPRMSVDVPANGSTVSQRFAVAGWAVDLGSQSGPGVNTVHVWAQSVATGQWIGLGAASMGVLRTDVSSAFQSWNFSSSGFGMTAELPPGTYDLNVFAFSTVANAFNNVQTKRITVVAPPSAPRMSVDLPAVNQTVTRSFSVAGWAVDLASPSGPGVSTVHVWAYPSAGGAPISLGAASMGYFRPDVAVAFGDWKFSSPGFGLSANLPPGEYDLVVFAFSSVAGTFNNAVRIHIRVV